MALAAGTMDQTESLLAAVREQQPDGNEPQTIYDGLESAVNSELVRLAAARYLSPYGITMQQFLSEGSTYFTDEIRSELARKIADHADNYDAELIFAGWGAKAQEHENGKATIFGLSRDGVSRHSDASFYAIGSGATAAYSMLSYLHCRRSMTLLEIIYRVVGAKVAAERVPGVGENTLMWIATKKHGDNESMGFIVQPSEIHEIKELWEKRSAPRVDDQIEGYMVDILKKHFPSGVPMTTVGAFTKLKRDMKKSRRLASQTSEDQQ
jgi:hypothetical protein